MKNKLVFTIARYLLALPMIIFGANKFLAFADVPPPTGETAQLFMGAMFGSYLAKLVGLTEILGGVLLLLPRTAFIGLLLLLPLMANIIAFHVAHDMPGNGIWIFSLLATVVVCIGFKEKFAHLTIA